MQFHFDMMKWEFQSDLIISSCRGEIQPNLLINQMIDPGSLAQEPKRLTCSPHSSHSEPERCGAGPGAIPGRLQGTNL